MPAKGLDDCSPSILRTSICCTFGARGGCDGRDPCRQAGGYRDGDHGPDARLRAGHSRARKGARISAFPPRDHLRSRRGAVHPPAHLRPLYGRLRDHRPRQGCAAGARALDRAKRGLATMRDSVKPEDNNVLDPARLVPACPAPRPVRCSTGRWSRNTSSPAPASSPRR